MKPESRIGLVEVLEARIAALEEASASTRALGRLAALCTAQAQSTPYTAIQPSVTPEPRPVPAVRVTHTRPTRPPQPQPQPQPPPQQQQQQQQQQRAPHRARATSQAEQYQWIETRRSSRRSAREPTYQTLPPSLDADATEGGSTRSHETSAGSGARPSATTTEALQRLGAVLGELEAEREEVRRRTHREHQQQYQHLAKLQRAEDAEPEAPRVVRLDTFSEFPRRR